MAVGALLTAVVLAAGVQVHALPAPRVLRAALASGVRADSVDAGWAVQQVPPAMQARGRLGAASCPSASFCVAVGERTGADGTLLPLVERWDGTAWTVMDAPSPGQGSRLTGVWCTSSTACLAVGSSTRGDGTDATLAERWDGTSWTVMDTPNPDAQANTFAAVACASPTACLAVGSSTRDDGNEVTLAASWDGTTWTAQSPRNPVRVGTSRLSGVSCPTATSCMAVGAFGNGDQLAPLAELWNGGTGTEAWAIKVVHQPTPDSQARWIAFGSLASVSCPSVTVCVAVGSYAEGDSEPQPLAERWDGTTWSMQEPPLLPGAHRGSRGVLASVSCISPSACTAVADTSGDEPALAESWDGSRWRVQATPKVGSERDQLYGVSCPRADACVAIGTYLDGDVFRVTLAEHWNGRKWSVQTTVNPVGARGNSQLASVWCASPAACVAVGESHHDIGPPMALAEHWDGTAWAVQPMPDPDGLPRLRSLACPSATACVAVGFSFGDDTEAQPLAEHWDGTAWTLRDAPAPAGTDDAALNGVACTSPTACVAVGNHAFPDSSTGTLIEIWDGVAWTVQASPNPDGAQDSDLKAVSCISDFSCTAVGTYVDASGTRKTLAEHWDGATWTVQASPDPDGAQEAELDGVACTSATACTAVGTYIDDSGARKALAERTDGTTWTVQATPDTTNDTALTSVSCTSGSACTAVGTADDGNATLAEAWDGNTWTVQDTPNPRRPASFTSVSCPTPTTCTAVGSYEQTDATVPLAATHATPTSG